MKNVYLIRHGQASAGTDNYDRLSPLGIKQAELLGEYWKHSEFEISAAFSGSLERQQHTAELAMAGLSTQPKLGTITALNEYDHTTVDQLFGHGIAEPSDWNLSFEQYLAIMQRWNDAGSDIPDKAESWQSFSLRGWHSVQSEVTSTDSTSIAFFTSGGVIATIVAKVLNLPFEKTIEAIWHLRNASVTQLQINDTNSALVDYNCIPHLQMHHDKSLITQI